MTAVEQLLEDIIKLTGVNIDSTEPIVQKAKEMEKEQIINAYWDGTVYPFTEQMIAEATQYYNETYGQCD